MQPLIIPSITSHSRTGSTWRDKIEELRTLPITRLALFVTGLNLEERIECYHRLLEVRRHRFFTIPFVHAVTDMSNDEFEFLVKNFSTERFNLHPLTEYPLQHPLSRTLRRCISIENSSSDKALLETDLEGFNGICLDLSHYESLRRKDPLKARQLAELAREHGVAANHLSGISDYALPEKDGRLEFSSHFLSADVTVNYAATLPEWMFAPVCALEVENTLSEQLAAIEHLNILLASRHPLLAA